MSTPHFFHSLYFIRQCEDFHLHFDTLLIHQSHQFLQQPQCFLSLNFSIACHHRQLRHHPHFCQLSQCYKVHDAHPTNQTNHKPPLQVKKKTDPYLQCTYAISSQLHHLYNISCQAFFVGNHVQGGPVLYVKYQQQHSQTQLMEVERNSKGL